MADRFGSAVEELVDSLQRNRDVNNEALLVVVRELEAFVMARYGLSPSDSSEVVSEVMTRFFERSLQDDVDPKRAAGLLRVIARNVAVDFHRRTRRETPSDDVERELERRVNKDDEIAAMLDRRADRAAIVQAMRAALALDDLTTVRITRFWLDLADELGRAPTAREVAAVAGVSHSTVLRALDAFREYVPGDPVRPKNE